MARAYAATASGPPRGNLVAVARANSNSVSTNGSEAASHRPRTSVQASSARVPGASACATNAPGSTSGSRPGALFGNRRPANEATSSISPNRVSSGPISRLPRVTTAIAW